MTVYVDDVRIPATVGRYRSRWSHLFTDSADLAELHAFAARIGLRRAWFQHKPGPGYDFSHYDVTDGKRRQAIAAGAVEVPWLDTPDILHRAHTARQATQRTDLDGTSSIVTGAEGGIQR